MVKLIDEFAEHYLSLDLICLIGGKERVIGSQKSDNVKPMSR